MTTGQAFFCVFVVFIFFGIVMSEELLPWTAKTWHRLTESKGENAIRQAVMERNQKFYAQVAKLIGMGMNKDDAEKIIREEMSKESADMAKAYKEAK